ncbi:Lrp/AsnC ligand binding domain-containing protein, partial [Vibrio parahaemolyticus]
MCPSLDGYEMFVRRKLVTIPGVANIESSFALGQVKRSHVFPIMPS